MPGDPPPADRDSSVGAPAEAARRKKRGRSRRRTAWVVCSFVPLLLGVIVIAVLVQRWSSSGGRVPDLGTLKDGGLTEAQEKAIDSVGEINKYLISIVTLLFAVVGFCLKSYSTSLHRWPLALSLFMSLGLLILGYTFAFLTYAELTAELAQDVLDLYPQSSLVLRNLELEFYATAGATAVLFAIVVVQITCGPRSSSQSKE